MSWGGARTGAGRKKAEIPKKIRGMRLTDDEWAFLKDALKKTNELQLDSDRQNALLAAGQIDDVAQVVIASQKADIALQLTLQLRNRAISAYQEIMRMQV